MDKTDERWETTATFEDTRGFAERVREWRHGKRWTQQRLAEVLGYDVSYVAKIEQARRPPSRQFVTRINELLAEAGEELPTILRLPSEQVRLPVTAAPLLGREQDVERISRLLLSSARCVTLVGAPGVGKTSVAVEVAWRLARDFRHGAFFIGLTDIDEARSVPAAIGAGLGLVARSDTEPRELVTAVLAARHTLVVLDNFEHLLDASSFVETLVHGAPHLKILVTSREALQVPVETEYRLATLPYPRLGDAMPAEAEEYAAVAVFVRCARTVRPSFRLSPANAEAVVDVCARLDGLPLAIRLAACTVSVLSPLDIAARLRDRFDLLGSAEGPRGLTGALRWSWELLTPAQQTLLSRLAVFAGGCTIGALEAVCSDREEDVLTAVAALVKKNLIEVEHGDLAVSRFSLLETVRRFALDRLVDAGQDHAARRRHCHHYLRLAEAAAPYVDGGAEQVSWLDILEKEYANLASAIAWSLAYETESALRLGAALWRFLSLRHLRDGRTWLRAALELSDDSSVNRLRVQIGAAVLARLQGDLVEAGELLEQAADVADRLGAAAERAFAIHNLGIVDEQRGDYQQAEARFHEATNLFGTLGDERGLGHALNCLGVLAIHRGDDAASPFFLEALGRFRSLKDDWSVAVTSTNLGWIAETRQLWSEARRWYDETRRIWEELGDEHGVALSLADLGRVARQRGELASAERLLQQAMRLFHRTGDRRLLAACLLELAAVAERRRRDELAAWLVGAAQGVRRRLHASAWPHERSLEEAILADLSRTMDRGGLSRARSAACTLSPEDAVELAECGTWPPPSRRSHARPASSQRLFLERIKVS